MTVIILLVSIYLFKCVFAPCFILSTKMTISHKDLFSFYIENFPKKEFLGYVNSKQLFSGPSMKTCKTKSELFLTGGISPSKTKTGQKTNTVYGNRF